MNGLHAQRSGLRMHRAGCSLTNILLTRAFRSRTTSPVPNLHQVATSLVPPVCSFLGCAAVGRTAVISKMSEDHHAAKKARFDPALGAVAAATAPCAPESASKAAVDNAPEDVTSSPTSSGSRHRIRRSRSRSPVLNGNASNGNVASASPVRHMSSVANGNAATTSAVAELRAAGEVTDAVEPSDNSAEGQTRLPQQQHTPQQQQQQQQKQSQLLQQQNVAQLQQQQLAVQQLLQQQEASELQQQQQKAVQQQQQAVQMQHLQQKASQLQQQQQQAVQLQQQQQPPPQQPKSSQIQQQEQKTLQLQQQRPNALQQQQQTALQLLQQSQKQQRKQQQQVERLTKKQKRQLQQPVYEIVAGIHQCIKMDMPHEAFYLYQRIKTVAPSHKMDTATVSSLLNLVVGKWRWELQQRYQHLVRHATAAGQDTAPLTAAYEACVAAVMNEKEQSSKQGADQYARVFGADPPGIPAAMKCHIEKHIEPIDPSKLQQKMTSALLSGINEADKSIPMQELIQSAVTIALADLESGGQSWDEAIYLQLARVAAITGNTDKAYDYAKQLVSAWQSSGQNSKLAPRLRDFQPALVGYALSGQADKAQEIVNMMTQTCGLDLTEPEFGLWLEAIANGGTCDQMSTALNAVAGELNELRGTTVEMVENFFRSDRAAAAGHRWQQQWVKPDDQGHVREAGIQLQLADLSDADWTAFGQQVLSLAVQQEKKQGRFEEYAKWVRRRGPFDVMIDGANVALWGENYEGGGFKPEKLKVMYETVAKENPDAKILLILHAGRFGDIQRHHKEMFTWLQQLKTQGNFAIAPAGSNDDWYWMYAAVMAREKGMLVSDDLLRDHVWNLLRPKHMLKWTERHIIRFTFNFEKTEAFLKYPLPYTPCVQYNEAKGVWMVPCADRGGQWLCVRKV